ncbi:MAG: HdaA/DnaA family protein [Gammaproteobacteria bacterium]
MSELTVAQDARFRQLALAFPLRSRCRFEDFEADAAAETVAALAALAVRGAVFRGCLLWGGAASGKTHLLQATCQAHADHPDSALDAPPGLHTAPHRHASAAIYLPLGDPKVTPDALEGLETCGLVALDDIDHWFGDTERERALLALYQVLMARGRQLVVSASAPPSSWRTRYPDLGSRLRALPTYGLPTLSDAGKAAVLRRLGAERGLDLAPAVLDFWLVHGSREFATLLQQFEQLDRAAWSAGRRITIPLLKSVLAL